MSGYVMEPLSAPSIRPRSGMYRPPISIVITPAAGTGDAEPMYYTMQFAPRVPQFSADNPELRIKPFTRRMLLEYLDVVIAKMKKSADAPPADETPSLGEVWWERLK